MHVLSDGVTAAMFLFRISAIFFVYFLKAVSEECRELCPAIILVVCKASSVDGI